MSGLPWLSKNYSSCWDNDVTRNVCLNVFERVCILNEDEIQITSSSRHQGIAKIASHKSKRLHVQPKLNKCQRQGLGSIKKVWVIYNIFSTDDMISQEGWALINSIQVMKFLQSLVAYKKHSKGCN